MKKLLVFHDSNRAICAIKVLGSHLFDKINIHIYNYKQGLSFSVSCLSTCYNHNMPRQEYDDHMKKPQPNTHTHLWYENIVI